MSLIAHAGAVISSQTKSRYSSQWGSYTSGAAAATAVASLLLHVALLLGKCRLLRLHALQVFLVHLLGPGGVALPVARQHDCLTLWGSTRKQLRQHMLRIACNASTWIRSHLSSSPEVDRTVARVRELCSRSSSATALRAISAPASHIPSRKMTLSRLPWLKSITSEIAIRKELKRQLVVSLVRVKALTRRALRPRTTRGARDSTVTRCCTRQLAELGRGDAIVSAACGTRAQTTALRARLLLKPGCL